MSLARIGDHICCLFDTDEEHLAIAARYIAEGLRKREHCLYSGASTTTLHQFRHRLAAQGVDVDEAVASGALTLGTAAEMHLASGAFDAERMLGMLSDKLETVLNDGFTGLRTCGDMSWLLDNASATENVVTYEALCTQFFESSRAAGMCLYDRARLPPGLIDHALTTHPRTMSGGVCTINPRDRSHAIAAAFRRTPGADQRI